MLASFSASLSMRFTWTFSLRMAAAPFKPDRTGETGTTGAADAGDAWLVVVLPLATGASVAACQADREAAASSAGRARRNPISERHCNIGPEYSALFFRF